MTRTPIARKHKAADSDQENRDPKRQRAGSSSPGDERENVDTGLESSAGIDDRAVVAVGTVVRNRTERPASDSALSGANALSGTTTTLGIPITADQLTLRPAEVDYMSTEFIARLVTIINFVDATANRYSVGLMPANTVWGPIGDGTGLDKYLCLNGRPIALWMAGVVTSVWFTPTEGTRVNVGIRLLNDRDQEVARRIQYGRCRPEGDASNVGVTTYASRFLSSRGETASSSFEEVHNATEALESWTSMPKDSPDSVNKTDVVLVECYVRRFKPQREQGVRQQGWTVWGVNFELLRVARLLGGPGPAELVPEESHVRL